jgi:hypothetical protein
MPINIPCEYECDQCAVKVAGTPASLPVGWVEYSDVGVLSHLDAGAKSKYVFDTQECKDAFVTALLSPPV